MNHAFVEEITPKLQQWRRKLHAYPEIGFTEYMTTWLIGKELEKLGFSIYLGEEAMDRDSRLGLPSESKLASCEEAALEAGVDPSWLEKMQGGMTGLVAVWDTGKEGEHLAFRFDIDALPIMEEKAASHFPAREGFQSTIEGTMHACGHDGHATIGLGVASYIATHAEELKGKFTLIFQPAEEGGRGAKAVTAKGWLDDVDSFWSGHIGVVSLPVGTIAASVAGFLASTKMNVRFKGVSSHAGMHPELGKNALLAAATAVTNLYAIPRHAGGASRVNVGKMEAGSGRNIIPSDAYLEIETRGETAEVNVYMTEQANRILRAAAAMHDVQCTTEHAGVTEQIVCDQWCVDYLANVLQGADCVKEVLPVVQLSGSEDASFMMKRVQENGGKATYMLFGSKLDYPHHHPAFDFEEGALPVAVETFIRVIEGGSRIG